MVLYLPCLYSREPRQPSHLHQVPKVVGASSGVSLLGKVPYRFSTHHEGIGEAQSHQAGTQLPVQRVGDGGHGSDEDHTCPDIFLQMWGASLVLRVWDDSAQPSGLRAAAESSSADSQHQPHIS